MKKNTVTVYTIAYGDYWERFGKKWEENMLKLDPAPDELFIVTDKEIDTKLKYYILKSNEVAEFRNFAVEKANIRNDMFSRHRRRILCGILIEHTV